ncbi:glycosyltransferase [Nocardioides sp. CFH 31398]|uniref:glycosyltransferase n=1 Tax=Nocardioides sp. CFH 31398 TaxID=2919579 RepID=UPI001F061CE4|nr:glycosyltransferase [Nocardioides sp. CFH 31398]MCH1868720.1 glycosyltransferase [Nocardioides sp. CFH 31398]
MTDGPRVSVVVAHYDQPAELARTLAALARQDAPVQEVLVADDGSPTALTLPDGVRLVRQPDAGFRAARVRNRGARAATGDVLVFLDADTAPEPSYVGALAAVVAAEPDVLAVGLRHHTAFPADLDPADPLRGAVEHALPDPSWLADGWRATDDLRAADASSFRFVISATMACSAAWFARVGGFDGSLVGYGGEDWDLAHRWWTAGGRLRHVPAAVAWHDGPAAGEGERALDPTSDRRTREAVAVGRRVNAWPVALRGLRSAPPRVVVTHAPELTDAALLVSVDGLLAADPQAVVVSDRGMWSEVGDDRVRRTLAPVEAGAALRVHLHRGVRAEPDAWRALLAPPPAGVGEVDRGPEGSPYATVTDLRLLRRDALGLEPLVRTTEPAPDGITDAAGVALDAWLGGWA